MDLGVESSDEKVRAQIQTEDEKREHDANPQRGTKERPCVTVCFDAGGSCLDHDISNVLLPYDWKVKRFSTDAPSIVGDPREATYLGRSGG